jgi:hypothetical protein
MVLAGPPREERNGGVSAVVETGVFRKGTTMSVATRLAVLGVIALLLQPLSLTL